MSHSKLPMLPSMSSPKRRRITMVTALSAGLLVWAASAAAQDAIDNEFTVQRFDPAPGPRNYFTTRGVRTDGNMAWSGGLVINYAYKPFVVRSCRSETDCDDPNASNPEDVPVVENMITGDFMGSLTPIPRLQVSLRVPVTWVKGQGLTDRGTTDPNGLSAVGMGDAQVEGKYRLYGNLSDPFVVGAGLFATGPLGHATAKGNFIGDATPTVGIRGIFDGDAGPFSFGGNLAGVYRGEGRVGSTTLGPEFRYGVAAGFRVSPVIRIVADGFGATKFSSKNGTNTLEVDGGFQILPTDSSFVILAGAGTGVIQGVGVPAVRGFAGLMYVAERRDRDGDGIYDQDDQCPTEAEDKDGVEDSDGCPDLDNDGDTIQDSADKCPTEPEHPDGFEDTDGCPDLDNDKDGINDDRDRCPDKPETKNGYKDDDGCPDEPDSDNDGVPDSRDKCPNEAEDTDGYQDTDGCPDPDNDGDGILDNDDECVDQPETKNGFEDEDGCPDEAPADKNKKKK